MDAGGPPPPGGNDGDARGPRKNNEGVLDAFGDSSENPFWVFLLLAALFAEYMRTLYPCTC